jgi:hypothetical protein
MIDQTILDSVAILEKSLICGNAPGSYSLTVNGGSQTISAPNMLNRIPLAVDRNKGIKLM